MAQLRDEGLVIKLRVGTEARIADAHSNTKGPEMKLVVPRDTDSSGLLDSPQNTLPLQTLGPDAGPLEQAGPHGAKKTQLFQLLAEQLGNIRLLERMLWVSLLVHRDGIHRSPVRPRKTFITQHRYEVLRGLRAED